jgi:hypothetical protein
MIDRETDSRNRLKDFKEEGKRACVTRRNWSDQQDYAVVYMLCSTIRNLMEVLSAELRASTERFLNKWHHHHAKRAKLFNALDCCFFDTDVYMRNGPKGGIDRLLRILAIHLILRSSDNLRIYRASHRHLTNGQIQTLGSTERSDESGRDVISQRRHS